MKRHMELLMGILLLLAVFAFTGPFPVWEMAGKQTNGIPVENGREQEVENQKENGSENRREDGSESSGETGGAAVENRGESGEAESKNSGDSQKVIVLDPGHGGSDPGKIGVSGTKEKDINLSVTYKAKELLEQNGITVILTREADQSLSDASAKNKKLSDLEERCRIINESGAAFAVSIHQNSYSDPSVRGSQVFYYKSSAEGKKLAEALQTVFNDTISREKNRRIKENTSYYLLIHVKCPIVIAECGFLSNPDEEQKLSDDAYQDQVAEALAKGILEYLGKAAGE